MHHRLRMEPVGHNDIGMWIVSPRPIPRRCGIHRSATDDVDPAKERSSCHVARRAGIIDISSRCTTGQDKRNYNRQKVFHDAASTPIRLFGNSPYC
jgi:hypothetical protein